MKQIFVFGSNLAGVHGAGAARFAFLHCGAKAGEGIGLHGDSYAIPTKNARLESLDLDIVDEYVIQFVHFAKHHPELEFKVTRIGCGLAGFKDEDIAPMFGDAPKNCLFDDAWRPWLKTKKFWGTF